MLCESSLPLLPSLVETCLEPLQQVVQGLPVLVQEAPAPEVLRPGHDGVSLGGEELENLQEGCAAGFVLASKEFGLSLENL